MVWKHLKIQGMHLVITMVYFDQSIGMTGPNLTKFQKIIEARNRGKVKLIVAADFNMTPATMRASGMLASSGLSIITAGDQATCKHSYGHSQIDYLLVDTDITALIGEVELVTAKSWSAHFGLTFTINCRPATIKTWQLVRPKPIPYEKDGKGQLQQWQVDEDEWHHALQEATEAAETKINATELDDSGAWQHAANLGITDSSKEKAIRYAAWSIACEQVALKANPPEKDAHKHTGRGLMPTYELRSLAEKSKHKYTEHLMWELAANDSVAGPDLYSTLWNTIAGTMERGGSTATSIRP